MTTETRPRVRKIRGRWLLIGIVLVILAILVAVFLGTRSSQAQTSTERTVAVTRGSITATVDGSGTVAAAQELDLNFQTSGTVTEILVQEGDTVTAGQPLAKIDNRDLESQVASAQASLDSAKAQLAQAEQGSATSQEIAAQEASVRNAEASLKQTKQGSSTAADVADAQASLRSAEADLAALKDPSAADVSAAELKVQQAQNTLQSTRTSYSASKTNAELALQQSTDALTKAQSAYATAKSNWEYVEETGADPTNPTTTNSAGKKVKNKLNDVQQQQYYDTYVEAEASLRSAEKDVTKAQVDYDQARQDEVTKIQDGEQSLADAQHQLDALRNPDKNDIAKAQASVDSARAKLNKAKQGGTQADIEASQANVDKAKADLASLTAPKDETDLEIQQSSVDQAEQTLKQAQLALENATLKAPFGGIITTIDIVPGSVVSTSGEAAMRLVNREPLHVDMSLSENDVAKVEASQAVSLTIDALDEWSAQGTVAQIATAGEENNGVVTYQVRVSFPDTDTRVKIGMTANVSIVTASKNNVLLVPTTALLPKGTSQVVQVQGEGSGAQPVTEIEVQTGLTDGTYTEIVSGLNEGQTILSSPSENTQSSGGPSGPFGN